jgi:hypothetical protein
MKVLAISSSIEINKVSNCETKIVKYKHSTDAYGFEYSDNPTFYQQFRLSLMFGRIPKFPVKEKMYRQSDGVFRVTQVSIDKEYTLKTGYFDENTHKALQVALKHDSVYIDDVLFANRGEYEIEGDDDETLTNLTTAKTAILQQGYNKTSISC